MAALLRVPYWIYILLAVGLMAVAVLFYIRGIEVVDGADLARERSKSGDNKDLSEIVPDTDVGPLNDVSLMVQVNDRLITDLGPIGAEGERLHMYVLFSVHDDYNTKLARAVMIVESRSDVEVWMKDQLIGTAQMGGLYSLYGYKFFDRRIKSAVIGQLSKFEMTSAPDIFMFRPGPESTIPKVYINPDRSELLTPILFMLFGGIVLLFGLHTKAIQKRGKEPDDPALDPILAVDSGDEDSVLRKRF